MTTFPARKQDDESSPAVFGSSGSGVGKHRTRIDNTAAEPLPAPAARDGQHDFDFVIGTWKSHVRRLQKATHRINILD